MQKSIQSKTFWAGLVVGILAALGGIILVRTGGPVPQRAVLAEIQGEALTQEALRRRVGPFLIPVENDEYRVFQQGVEEWVQNRLLEKEAKAEGVALEELYRKEIWSRVQVSYETVLRHYNQHRELYPNQSLDQIVPFVTQELRNQEYVRVKEEYLKGLRKKYQVKVYLKKPASFVEGLALPPSPGARPVPAEGQGIPPAPAFPKPAEIGKGLFPSKGPENAAITLMEFSDFHCPFCKRIAPTLEKVLANYPGKVRLVFRHYPLSQTPGAGSFLTHEAAACAHEQGKFWEFHDAVFASEKPPQEADLETIAQKLGLDLPKFQDCLKGGKFASQVESDRVEGNRKGVQGTPTVFVNDQVVAGALPYEYFTNVIEGILDPSKAKPSAALPNPVPGPQPGVPSAVRFDDLEGRPAIGPKNAPITLVEFSDFYCPFCKRATPTIEQLMKNYEGKIRRIWRHYPLSFHVGSERVHEASECAYEQGKFWQFHDKVFEKQGSPLDDPALLDLAKEVGLNKKKFEKCLKGGKYKDLIQKDISKGNQAGVNGTPAFFVNGQLVSGAQPYENFDRIVKSELVHSQD